MMTCQPLLDRIRKITETLGNSSHLTPFWQQVVQGNVPSAQQLQYLLEQDLKQRQRLSTELQTLTRQLELYLKWQSDSPAENVPPSVATPNKSGETSQIANPSALSSVFGNTLIRKRISQLKELATIRHQTEQERQRYHDLFEFAPDGYLTTNEEGLIQQVNSTASQLLKVEPSQLVGTSLLGFVADTEGKDSLSQAMVTVAQRDHDVQTCEVQLSPQQGEPFPAAIRLSALAGDDKNQRYFRCLLQDISERKQVYRALTASEKKWKALFEQSFQLMVLLDAQGNVMEVNQTGLQWMEQSLEEITGQAFWELPWWDQQESRQQVQQWIQLGKLGSIVRHEVTLVTASGESIPVDLSLKAVRDESDQVVLLIAEGRDLRDRARKETQLRREKEISDSIIQSLPGLFYMIQKNGPLVRWNQELENITGYTEQEIRTMDPLDFFVSSDRAYIYDKIQEAFTHGKSTAEATFLGKHQQKTTYHFSSVAIALDDGQQYLIGVAIDITESNRLKDERQKLASLVENSQDLISLTTLDGQIQFVNPSGEELLGINPTQGNFPLFLKNCFSASSQSRFEKEIYPNILETGQWYGELELQNLRNGSLLPVLTNIFLIRDSFTAAPINLGVITRNISNRKQTELALQASEERFRSIFEQAAVGIALCDCSGILERVNQRVCEILGYPEQDLLNHPYYEFISPEFAEKNEQLMQQLLTEHLNTCSQEQRYYRQDGSFVWVNLTMSLISYSQKEPSSLLLILEDISDRKYAEAALQQSEEKYRSLVNGIREVIFQIDACGNWQFLNPAWTEITGYPVEHTLGKPFLNYTYPPDFQTNQQYFARLMNHETDHCRYELRYKTQSGGFCWLEMTARVTTNNQGEITGITGTLIDMTQRRQVEDQLRAVINTVPGLVSWVTREGRYLGVNQKLANTVNLNPQDFVDQEIGFLGHSSSFVQLINDFLATSETQTRQEIETTIQGDCRNFLIAGQKYRQGNAAVLIGIDITERKQAELALKESEIQFRQLAENIEQVFWMVDLEQQRFIYISPAYELIWGYSVDSVYDCPTNMLQAIHPEDYQRMLQAIPKQIRGDYDQEYRIIRADGEIRWIRDRAFPVRNDQGDVYRIAGLAEDITERKRSKEALKKRERYLKALVGLQRRLIASAVDQKLYQEVLAILGDACEASRIYVYENFIDEQGQLKSQKAALWCSPKLSPKFRQQRPDIISYQQFPQQDYEKLSQGEFLQKTVANLPQQEQKFFQQYQVQSFLMIPLIVNRQFFGFIGFDNCENDANWGRLEVGLLSSAAAAIALAKEKQLTQEKLQQQLTAIETSTDGIMIIDVSGELQYVNPAYCQMLGYDSPENLLGTQWQNHHSPDEISRIQEEIFPQLQSQGKWGGEILAQRQDGSTFIQELSINLSHNGKIVGVCRDISQRKEAEEQLKASLEEKELLLKEVHHRVKNNLQVISSIFSLQSQTIEDEQALAIIEESQNRITSMALIHEKLYQAANLANIDFADYIQDLTSNLLMSYNVSPDWIQTEMNIESIQMTLDSAIPCGLLINELVSNSLKHGFPDGRRGTISIFLGYQNEQQDTLLLKVEDNGVGLPEDFNPNQTSSLGVSLISSLTKQLRGTLQFQNNPGASFEITFPKPIERKRF